MLTVKGWTHVHLEQYSEAEKILRRSLGLNGELIWAWLGHAIALAMIGRQQEAKEALVESVRVGPDFGLSDLENFLKALQGNPTGERGAVLDRQVGSVLDIWPS